MYWPFSLLFHHKEGRGKNGFVNESKHSLVTTAERNNMNLIAVVMKANQKEIMYHNTMQLFDYGFSGFESKEYAKGKSFRAETGETVHLPDGAFLTKKRTKQ
jgi:D-alanyl-D-alanine carboxypeptidase